MAELAEATAGGWHGLALGLLLALAAGTALAGGCQAHSLGPGLCDADGDGVADPPRQARDWLDPPTLVIGVVGLSGSGPGLVAVRANLEQLRAHIERQLGRKTVFLLARDTRDLSRAFRAQQAHLVLMHTGAVEEEVACGGLLPLAQPVGADGELSGYRMEIVVPAASPVRELAQLRGLTLTFVDESSASGYKLPVALLRREAGLELGRDYRAEFSGRHDGSILAVSGGLAQAAAVAGSIRRRLEREGLVTHDSLRVIYASQVLPKPPWGVSHRLHPQRVQALRAALLSFPGGPKGLQEGDSLRPARYREDWAGMRELNRLIGSTPSCLRAPARP
ncbi:MAG: phosphate/phosphite/phosphonate ABC transporter substrate-binding protein [Inhella sp.]